MNNENQEKVPSFFYCMTLILVGAMVDVALGLARIANAIERLVK